MIIKVKITPKSKLNQILDFENDILKIKIKAVPEKGKANQELINFLSDILSISKSSIKILSGEHAKIKLIQIDNITLDTFKEILKKLKEKK
jgi:uncharacterized protein